MAGLPRTSANGNCKESMAALSQAFGTTNAGASSPRTPHHEASNATVPNGVTKAEDRRISFPFPVSLARHSFTACDNIMCYARRISNNALSCAGWFLLRRPDDHPLSQGRVVEMTLEQLTPALPTPRQRPSYQPGAASDGTLGRPSRLRIGLVSLASRAGGASAMQV